MDDVVSAFLTGLQYNGDCRVMNVGSGVGRSIYDVAQDVIGNVPDCPSAIRYLPASSDDAPAVVLDTTLIAREMDWKPKISWLEGLRNAISDIANRTA